VIVDRYLIRQLLTPFLAGWLLLTVVFAAFIAAMVLADAAAGEISAGALWRLIGLRCVIAAEVLVPTAMFFAVLFTFERLNRDRELVALLVGGLSRPRLLRPLAGLGLLLLIGVAVLALAARPWAYRMTYMVEDRAARVEMGAMRPGSFHSLGPDLAVTANGVDGDGRLVDVFARQELRPGLRIIRAERARLLPAEEPGDRLVEFESGQAITVLPETEGSTGGDRRHRFDRLRYRWTEASAPDGSLNRRARTTGELMDAVGSKERAELQWRFTMPLLTFGMLLLAGTISTLGPGRVTSLRMIGAIGAYVAVFNVAAAARSALENGLLPALPGIWWLPLLPLALAGIVLLLARRSN
jgi:lipopolysaccharide export system permease protein